MALPSLSRNEMTLSPRLIEDLFGSEAAESENDDRLRDYFYRSQPLREFLTTTPLKIAVGFKGTGKSALLRMGYLNDLEDGHLALWITPDDLGGTVYEDAKANESVIPAIRVWKNSLCTLLADRLDDAPDKTDSTRKWVKRATDGERHALAKLFVEVGATRVPVSLYIDDLDRGWSAKAGDIIALTALLHALRDLCRNNPGLTARVSLRSDVYWDLRGADESLDKFEENVVKVRWSQTEILAVLVKRVVTFLGTKLPEDDLQTADQTRLAEWIGPVFAESFVNTRSWPGASTHRVLLSLVRGRPRDIIKLAIESGRAAARRSAVRVEGRDILQIVPDYSTNRLQDLTVEFRRIMPDLERVLHAMAPTRSELQQMRVGGLDNVWVYRTDRLVAKINNIRQRVQQTPGLDAMATARLLYRIGFVTARKRLPDGYIERHDFEEYPSLLGPGGDGGFLWEVHPAYRSALNLDKLVDWHSSVDLS